MIKVTNSEMEATEPLKSDLERYQRTDGDELLSPEYRLGRDGEKKN